MVTVFGSGDLLTPVHQGVLLRLTHGIPCVQVKHGGHVPLECGKVCEAILGFCGAEVPKKNVDKRGADFWLRFESVPSVRKTQCVLCSLYRALLGWTQDEFL